MNALVITGGYLNIGFAKEYIKTLSYDKVFAVDKGLMYADELNIVPDYIIGDFDTIDNEVLLKYENAAALGSINSKIIRHPVMKAQTDTELAVITAKDENVDEIILLGATGTRLDHVLCNIGMLMSVADFNVKCTMVDETNRINLLCSDSNMKDIVIERHRQFGKYISLIPITTEVKGVTMEGVVYPLDKATVIQGTGLTISNEINEKAARIHIEEGAALIIESKD